MTKLPACHRPTPTPPPPVGTPPIPYVTFGQLHGPLHPYVPQTPPSPGSPLLQHHIDLSALIKGHAKGPINLLHLNQGPFHPVGQLPPPSPNSPLFHRHIDLSMLANHAKPGVKHLSYQPPTQGR